MILHPFQQVARSKARAEYARGKRAIVYVAPTGAGKTVILGDTIASHVRHTRDARVNVYAHRRELVSQAAATFRAMGLEVGAHGEGRSAAVQVCSTQAVLASGQLDKCTLAVFDEAHHYAADTWGDVARLHKEHGATIVGATATPERGDGRPLNHMFDALVVVAQVKELNEVWRKDPARRSGLVPILDIKKPRFSLRKNQIAQSPRAAYEKFAKGRRAVVFASHVKAAEDFAAGWPEARVLHGKSTDRDETLAHFREHGGVIVNVNVLTEGWDDPRCDCVIIARRMGSVGMLIQSAGRGARAAGPSKDGYLLIDLMGVTVELGRPDDDREYSLDGECGISRGGGVVAEERLCKRCQAAIGDEDKCPRCGCLNGLVTPVDAGVELESWSMQKHFAKDDEETRRSRLAGWIRKAEARGLRGKSLYSVQGKYRAVYGARPSPGMWGDAVKLNRDMGWSK